MKFIGYSEVDWESKQYSGHIEEYSHAVSLHVMTSEDYDNGYEYFFFPHFYDVSLIFNV